MARAARQSKFRHVFAEPPKEEYHYAIDNPLTASEGQYVVANSKFFAVAKAGGGGPVIIRSFNQTGRGNANGPLLDVHKGKVLDFDFYPFADNMIATASEDCHVCVSKFPMEGLQENINEPLITLEGHQKKVGLCTFNPVAESLLASGGYDKCVKIWNIETAACIGSYEEIDDTVYSLAWSSNGSQLAVTGKDRQMRIYDPREPTGVSTFECFDGTKSSKAFWIPNFNWIGATGFSKNAKRQLKLWDLKSLNEPLFKLELDAQPSVLMPYYDNDHCILYLAGKGEASIQYYEIVDDDRKVYPLSAYRDNVSQKGGGWVPKKGLDVFKCEIARFLKLTQKSVIPLPFVVPRKTGSEIFQEDLYPDAYAGRPALSAAEWLEKKNKDPILMSLDPSKRTEVAVTFDKKKTYADLLEENSQLRMRIQDLENELNRFRGDNNQEMNNESTNQETNPTTDDNEVKSDV